MSRAPALVLSLALLTACPKPPEAEPLPETTVEVVPNEEATDVTATDMGPEAADPWTAPVPEKSPDEERREDIAKAVSYLSVDLPSTNKKAIPILEEVVAADPGNAYAHYNLGLAYEKVGQLAKARQSYLTAITSEKSLGAAYVNLAGLDMRSGNFKAAEAHYRNGIRNDRENMELWTGLIGSLRAQGRLEAAEQEAKEALQINTNTLAVYNNLGLVYIDMEKLDLAYFIVEKGLLVPGGDGDAGLHSTHGRVHQLRGKTGSAKDEFDKALERDPNYVPAMVYLSYYYLDNRNYEDTVAVLEKADRLNPDDVGILMNLAIAYRGVERYDEAIKLYERVKLLDPSNPAPYLNLGILYGDYTKDYDKAISEYNLYKARGGRDVAVVDGYIAATLKEQEKVRKIEERRRKFEETEKAAEAPEPAIEAPGSNEPAPEEAPADPVPTEDPAEPVPTEDPAEPVPTEDPDPWGGG